MSPPEPPISFSLGGQGRGNPLGGTCRSKEAEPDALGSQGGDLRGPHAVARAEAPGLGPRAVALRHRSSTSYQIREHMRCLSVRGAASATEPYLQAVPAELVGQHDDQVGLPDGGSLGRGG